MIFAAEWVFDWLEIETIGLFTEFNSLNSLYDFHGIVSGWPLFQRALELSIR